MQSLLCWLVLLLLAMIFDVAPAAPDGDWPKAAAIEAARVLLRAMN